MQLGKTLVGVIVGGAVGIGAMFLASTHHGWDGYWMAIVVALFIGLAVRWLTAGSGRASYFRGAITGVVSILLFIAGQYVTAQILTRGEAAKPIGAQLSDVHAAASADADDSGEHATEHEDAAAGASNDADAADPPADATTESTVPAEETAVTATESVADEANAPAEDMPQQPVAPPHTGANQRMPGSSTTDLVWLVIAALVGYSLGRGKDRPATSGDSPDDNKSLAPNRSVPPSD